MRNALQYQTSTAGREEYGFAWEGGDCTVRALVNATGVPYGTAHAWLKVKGRRDGEGYGLAYYLNHLDGPLFGHVFSRAAQWRSGPETHNVGQTLAHCWPLLASGGVFVVIVSGHVFVVRDGVLLDAWRPGPRLRVLHVFKVTPELSTDVNDL